MACWLSLWNRIASPKHKIQQVEGATHPFYSGSTPWLQQQFNASDTAKTAELKIGGHLTAARNGFNPFTQHASNTFKTAELKIGGQLNVKLKKIPGTAARNGLKPFTPEASKTVETAELKIGGQFNVKKMPASWRRS